VPELTKAWKGIMIGGEYGGLDVADWVEEDRVRLNALFDKYCAEPYNSEVTAIVMALRVEGRLKSFGFEGIDDVSRLKPQKAVGADISIRRKDWDTKPSIFRKFLWKNVQEGIWACVERVKKDKLAVDEDRLRRDLAKVEREFFAR
jgi:hypothetical protein